MKVFELKEILDMVPDHFTVWIEDVSCNKIVEFSPVNVGSDLRTQDMFFFFEPQGE